MDKDGIVVHIEEVDDIKNSYKFKLAISRIIDRGVLEKNKEYEMYSPSKYLFFFKILHLL